MPHSLDQRQCQWSAASALGHADAPALPGIDLVLSGATGGSRRPTPIRDALSGELLRLARRHIRPQLTLDRPVGRAR